MGQSRSHPGPPPWRLVSDHLTQAKRLEWCHPRWPRIVRRARRRKALRRFGDAASLAQWGSLRDTWAPKGQQPDGPTSGKRTADKVFGLIDSCSGRFFDKGHTGRFPSERSSTFLLEVLSQTPRPVVVIQDGTLDHTSKTMQAFLDTPAEGLTIEQLPAYSPDLTPSEHLWKKVKKEATHLKYCPEFTQLQADVDRALLPFAKTPHEITVLMARYGDSLRAMAR